VHPVGQDRHSLRDLDNVDGRVVRNKFDEQAGVIGSQMLDQHIRHSRFNALRKSGEEGFEGRQPSC
jgi:hypothetical protein